MNLLAKAIKSLRYRLEFLLVRCAQIFIPFLPYVYLQKLATFCGRAAFLLDKSSRKTAIANLACAFPEMNTRAQKRIASVSYASMARTALELFWLPRISAQNYRDYMRFEFEDEKLFKESLAKGAIFLTPHYANFEWLAFLSAHVGVRIQTIARDFDNPLLTPIFQQAREGSGHQIIPRKRALFRQLRHLRGGGSVALLPDLSSPPTKSATVIEVFGLKTCVTALHAHLAKMTGKPIIFGLSLPSAEGEPYVGYFYKPIYPNSKDSVQEIAQKSWNVFEAKIKSRPEFWLWMYKHWRYRPRADGEKYPQYANYKPKFERMLG